MLATMLAIATKKTDSECTGSSTTAVWSQNRAPQFQLLELILGFDNFGEIADCCVARDDEMLAAALGIARNEHGQQTYIHDEEWQHNEGNRQIVRKPRIVAEDRAHHEGDEQDHDIGLEISFGGSHRCSPRSGCDKVMGNRRRFCSSDSSGHSRLAPGAEAPPRAPGLGHRTPCGSPWREQPQPVKIG